VSGFSWASISSDVVLIHTRWDKFLVLHRMWLGYMSELLELPPRPQQVSIPTITHKIPNPAAMQAKLVKADFHGSIIIGKSAFTLLAIL
jgi:ribonuclease P protein subunit POP4